ncbi:Acetophenone carboxylase delta subunit [Labrenzia sp. THAF191b]|uniref:hydantoinase B/oxoprolinase family protein n=1 Tax=Stappiaceae TaxID=2821832 RepID=UPI0012680D26|nr:MULTISPECIES: hydantoinase B/oxoprolinase family protein [Stappiaceae]MCR9283356.1 hydantoinase B/oxoprolinase family protein [Paracoccaceae bacterium]MBO9421610.1 hydantoinase B/oxoprolinase family protein [Labrenzia sp. R4_2]QFS97226.1 Acetophenone carboxylase delta subunit [Labrenzia sp. THAF191b]QFT03541.1 Acetophenone carboxylase delta subunit [Labrenzia sp. THAF191a]QFT15083.1 Acetophenone carboxylase delta subunit [Labrenzia sp. THAF187b]
MKEKTFSLRTDSAQLDIFVQRFRSIAEEMGYSLQRTGHTAFVNETADLGVALVTRDGEIFGYPHSIGITMFANLNFKKTIDSIGSFEPGDIVVCNDPYASGGLSSHLPDISVLAPIYAGTKLICFAYAYVHSTDVGGRVAGSLSPSSYEIYQEGIRIPPSHLYKAGKLNEELLHLILCNCRVPNDNWGDLKAMVTALRVAQHRMTECFEKYSVDGVVLAMEDVLNYSEMRARAVIEGIPDGTYRFSDYLDDDVISEIPIKFCVALTVAGDEITIDFTGSDTQLRTAFNIYSDGKAHPWLVYTIMFVLLTIDRDIPVNAGLMRSVNVIAQPGSVVNCQAPAAVGLRTTTGVRVQDAIRGALAQALPKVIPAAGAGYIAPIVFTEPNLAEGGLKVNVLEPLVGGTGAHEDGDGLNARDVVDIANLRNSPLEVVESTSGVRILNYALRPDSGGAGKYRGGLGIIFDFEVLQHDCLVTARGQERHRFSPWGLLGGCCGEMAGVFIRRAGTKDFQPLAKIDSLNVNCGDVIRVLTPGGGGYGSPQDRDPAKVLHDVGNGLVSEKAARETYKVVIEDGALDLAGTERLRNELGSREAPAIFSFGPEREAYEAVWSEEAWSRLITNIFTLPIPLRASIRGRVWAAARRRAEETGKSLSAADIDDCWLETVPAGLLNERAAAAGFSNCEVKVPAE